MTRTRIGRQISRHDQRFVDYFETALTVRNYVEGSGTAVGDDAHGDTGKTLGETVETTGQVEQPQDPVETSTVNGESVLIDAEILLPDDVSVYDGTDAHPYPSEIETPSEVVYHVVHVYDEQNGRLRVYAIDSEEGA
ncbi:hypothetical protein [Halomarina litorea]|uniref:hypothetical protein n=1 Tax=Halomarina litorea TaxID=2961595 RepID=UPI0020C4803C|nr:hypothetical protein [Halomarina sp. BCD28]